MGKELILPRDSLTGNRELISSDPRDPVNSIRIEGGLTTSDFVRVDGPRGYIV